jgi:hypothetical protein
LFIQGPGKTTRKSLLIYFSRFGVNSIHEGFMRAGLEGREEDYLMKRFALLGGYSPDLGWPLGLGERVFQRVSGL